MEETKLLKEDLDLVSADETNDIRIVSALTKFLEDDRGESNVNIARTYPEEENNYRSHLYTDSENGVDYLVCSYDEAEQYAREDLESLADDCGGIIDAFGLSMCLAYFKDNYCDDIIEADARYRVDEMDDDDLIDELESYGFISEDDMVPDEDAEENDEDTLHYPKALLDEKREDLIQRYIDDSSRGADYISEVYGNDYLNEFIENNPDCIDIDGLIDNILNYDGFGNTLNHYDGSEYEIRYNGTDGHTHTLYVYRLN